MKLLEYPLRSDWEIYFNFYRFQFHQYIFQQMQKYPNEFIKIEEYKQNDN